MSKDLSGKKVELITFGMKTPKRPEGDTHVLVDCRPIQNPYGGSDHHSTEMVLDSPAYPAILSVGLMGILSRLRSTTEPVRAGVFCAYGVHRSRVVADKLQAALTGLGYQVTQTNL